MAASSASSSAASQATVFYSSFSSALDDLEAKTQKAASQQDFQEVLQAIAAARTTLDEQDLQGLLNSRDQEKYQKRLNHLQSTLATKQQQNTSRSGATSSSRFALRRPATMAANPSVAETASKVPASGIPSSLSQEEPAPSGQAAKAAASLQEARSSSVQVTLQTQRYISFKDLTGATSSNDGTDGLSLSLSNLTDCVIDLRQPPRPILAVTANNVKTSAILLPVVKGSVLVSGIEDCVLTVEGCSQFRMHGSKKSSILLKATSPATIEACQGLQFSSLAQDELPLAEGASAVPSTVRPEVQVQDFEAPSAGVNASGSQSWKVLSDSDRAGVLSRLRAILSQAAQGNSDWYKAIAQLQGPPQLYRDEDSGILLVFADPGKTATVEEFNDWYDNEHVPLRTLRFTEFRTAARYQVYSSSHAGAPDAQAFKAGWAASYTISTNGMYNNPAYSGLRTNRSPREGELVARLGVLDRRIYTLAVDSLSKTPLGDLTARTQTEMEAEARSFAFWGFDLAQSTTTVGEAEVKTWFSTSVEASLSTIEGCTRVRLLKLCDALVNGKQVTPSNGDAKHCGRWAIFAEFATAKVPEALTAQKVFGAFEVTDVEERKCELYRAWDATKALEGGFGKK